MYSNIIDASKKYKKLNENINIINLIKFLNCYRYRYVENKFIV
jgi:hypothetical protein